MEKAYPMSANLNLDFNILRGGNMSLMVIHEGTLSKHQIAFELPLQTANSTIFSVVCGRVDQILNWCCRTTSDKTLIMPQKTLLKT